MPLIARHCRRCNGPVPWHRVRPEGGKRDRFACVQCGGATTRIRSKRWARVEREPWQVRRDEADALWRLAIHGKALNGCCARCGAAGRSLQACHCHGRARWNTRWDVQNGLPCCAGCHLLIDSQPEEKRKLFRYHLGQELYDALEIRAQYRGKTDIGRWIMELKILLGRQSDRVAP